MIILDEYDAKGLDDFYGEDFSVNIFTTNDGQYVGTMSFYVQTTLDDDYIIYPYLANIVDEFQRRGIALEVIHQLNLMNYDVVFINSSNNIVKDKDDIHYSEAGYAFMRRCVELGYARDDSETVSDEYDCF